MTESFAQLFEEFLNETEFQQGSIVKGTVVAIENGFVLVDAGLKSESAIPAEQFKNAAGELEVEGGAEVDVALDAVEDGFGETQLSREKAKRHEAWIVLEKAYEEAETVVGIINGNILDIQPNPWEHRPTNFTIDVKVEPRLLVYQITNILSVVIGVQKDRQQDSGQYNQHYQCR